MFDFLENLRQRSETYRKTFAAVTSLLVTLLIFGVWFTAFSPVARTSAIVSDARSEDGPFRNLNRNVAQSIGAFKGQFDSIRDYFLSASVYEANNHIEFVPNETESSVFSTSSAGQKSR